MLIVIKRFGLLPLLAILLGGCFISQDVRVGDDESDYRKCLLQHTSQPALCDQLKQLYENDKND